MRILKMDKNKCPKLKTQKKFCGKKYFFYRNKSKTLFTKMRAFSRKITFLHFFAKLTDHVQKKPQFCILQNFFWFFFRAEKNETIKAQVLQKVLGVF